MRLIDADALDYELGSSDRDIYVRECLQDAPTVILEQHEIGYDDCSNALLKMWMDNVLTDGDYYRIANKLNEKWGKTELPEPYKGVTE